MMRSLSVSYSGVIVSSVSEPAIFLQCLTWGICNSLIPLKIKYKILHESCKPHFSLQCILQHSMASTFKSIMIYKNSSSSSPLTAPDTKGLDEILLLTSFLRFVFHKSPQKDEISRLPKPEIPKTDIYEGGPTYSQTPGAIIFFVKLVGGKRMKL